MPRARLRETPHPPARAARGILARLGHTIGTPRSWSQVLPWTEESRAPGNRRRGRR